MMFDITVDKQLDAKHDSEIITKVIQNTYPFLYCCTTGILSDDKSMIELKNNCVWFDIVSTPDNEIWVSAIDFHSFPDHISFATFPQIHLTEQISKALNCNCICSNTEKIISGLDENDPYWTLAYVNQQWYFADTANMKLMGSYTDGVNETAGNAELKLLYKLDLTKLKTNLYDYNILKRDNS